MCDALIITKANFIYSLMLAFQHIFNALIKRQFLDLSYLSNNMSLYAWILSFQKNYSMTTIYANLWILSKIFQKGDEIFFY